MLTPATNVLGRTDLDSSFADNKKPSGTDFATLIASGLNQKDDGIIKNTGSALAIEAEDTTGGPVLELWNEFSNENADWVLQINPNNDSTKLGFAISDGTSGMARFYIDKATGNTGIGTLTPNARLHLVPPDSSTPVLLVADAGNNNTLAEIAADGRAAFGTSVSTSDSHTKLCVHSTADEVARLVVETTQNQNVDLRVTTPNSDFSWTAFGSSNGFGVWDYNTSVRLLTIDGASHNVGIGTGSANPAARLTIKTDGTQDLLQLLDSSGNTLFEMDKTGVVQPSGILTVGGALQVTGSAASNWFSGALAVGQSSPAVSGTALQVNGILTVGDGSGPNTDHSGTNWLQAVSNTNTASRLQSINLNTGSSASAELRAMCNHSDFAWCADGTTNEFRVYDFKASTNRLYLKGDGTLQLPGSMAIGSTTSPATALDVTGAIQASDVLKINGTGASFVAGSLAVGKSSVTSGVALDVSGSIAASGALSAGATPAVASYGMSPSAQSNINCLFYAKGTASHTSIRVDAGSSDAFLHASTGHSSFALRAVGGSDNRCSIYDFTAGLDRLKIDSSGAVQIPGSLEVDGTLRVGGGSGFTGIKRILTAVVGYTDSTHAYSLKTNSNDFQTVVRSSAGVVILTVASGIQLDSSKTLCMVSLCDNGSNFSGAYDNTISCKFDSTTVTVTIYSNNLTKETESVDKAGTNTGNVTCLTDATTVGIHEDSPFSLMVIQLG